MKRTSQKKIVDLPAHRERDDSGYQTVGDSPASKEIEEMPKQIIGDSFALDHGNKGERPNKKLATVLPLGEQKGNAQTKNWR